MNEIAHQNGKIIHSPNAKLNWLSIFGLKVTKSVLWKIHIWLRLIAGVGTLCEIQHERTGVWQNNSIPRLFTDYSQLRAARVGNTRTMSLNHQRSQSTSVVIQHLCVCVFPKLMNAYEMWFLVTRTRRGLADWSWPHIFHPWPRLTSQRQPTHVMRVRAH